MDVTRQERRRVERKAERRRHRMERREARDRVASQVRRKFGHTQILAVAGDGMGNPEVKIGVKRGLLGHPLPHPMVTITEDELVAALDSTKELAPVLTKIGIVVLSQLTGFNLAMGPDDLVVHVAKWAGVDVRGLREAAILERHEGHGAGTAESGPDEPDCPCRGGQYNDECAATVACGFCAAERDNRLKEKHGADAATATGDLPAAGGGSGGDPAGTPVAPDEQRP